MTKEKRRRAQSASASTGSSPKEQEEEWEDFATFLFDPSVLANAESLRDNDEIGQSFAALSPTSVQQAAAAGFPDLLADAEYSQDEECV